MSQNLDAIINEVGFEIANILDENLINKLLGVLANDGVYAMWVYSIEKIKIEFSEDENDLKDKTFFRFYNLIYLMDRYITNKLNIKDILKKISELTKEINDLEKNKKSEKDKNKLKKIQNEINEKSNNRMKIINNYFYELSKDLHQLLFFKEMLEKALIYARYHAKALKDENNE